LVVESAKRKIGKNNHGLKNSSKGKINQNLKYVSLEVFIHGSGARVKSRQIIIKCCGRDSCVTPKTRKFKMTQQTTASLFYILPNQLFIDKF